MSFLSKIKDELTASPLRAVAIVADVLAVVTVVFSGFSIVTDGAFPQQVLAVVIGGIAIVFLVLAFVLQRRLYVERAQVQRSVQLGLALPKLAEAVNELTQNAGSNRDRRVFLAHVDAGCKTLSAMYGLATGLPCRVTVVETYDAGNKRLAVKRLSASYAESGRRPGRSNTDYVDENTDFQEIVENSTAHFFCNDLPSELGSGYRNSHWTRDRITEMKRSGEWSYRSTIVWPIRGWTTDEGDGRWDLRGFLCVDSTNVGTFDAAFDVSAGETFAGALYLGLTAFDDHDATDDADQGATA